MKIAVDIDNILWNFAAAFWEKLKLTNSAVPPPSHWFSWRFWEPYLDKKSFHEAINQVHRAQCSYSPYPDARSFLTQLRNDRVHIVIATHREREAFAITEKWLIEHELPFDELHLSNDKSVLFTECCALVDDSPLALEKAQQAGIIRAGLRCPWNAGSNQPLFDSLKEILDYLELECRKISRR
jgi:hypothetical protein